MCCFAAALLILGPRFGILVWWLVDQLRWDQAFDAFIWPLLGFIFLPWTTLMYVAVFQGGIDGFDWIILGIGLLADIFSYTGSAYGNREQLGSYTGRYR